MDNYIFTPQGFAVHWRVRSHNKAIARHDRRALYKQFQNDLHLDKLEAKNISFVLPKLYNISTNEINYLYTVRNTILIRFHNRYYAVVQRYIDSRINDLEREHALLKNRRVDEKKYLDNLTAKLKRTKDHQDYIALQSNVAKASTALTNTDSAIKGCEDEVAGLIRAKKDNLANWHKQVEIIEDVIETAIGNYIKRATSKIELEYGFTNFTHNIAKYNDEITKIIEGVY